MCCVIVHLSQVFKYVYRGNKLWPEQWSRGYLSTLLKKELVKNVLLFVLTLTVVSVLVEECPELVLFCYWRGLGSIAWPVEAVVWRAWAGIWGLSGMPRMPTCTKTMIKYDLRSINLIHTWPATASYQQLPIVPGLSDPERQSCPSDLFTPRTLQQLVDPLVIWNWNNMIHFRQ